MAQVNRSQFFSRGN